MIFITNGLYNLESIYPKLSRSHSSFFPNEVSGTSWPEGRIQHYPHLEAKLFYREQVSTNLGAKSIFPRIRASQSRGD
jgi:hypothetical protein